MRQTELHLTDEDRSVVDEIRSKGVHQSREVNRAHVLSSLDRGVPEAQIMAVLGVGRTAVWRTRAAYLQGGVELAVFDVARSGRPRQYSTDDEARVTALACSAPPAGRQRWTMMLTCEPLPRYSAAFSACLPHSVHWIAVDSSSWASPEPRRVLLIAVSTALAILPSRPLTNSSLTAPARCA
jgi:hypothetical protein